MHCLRGRDILIAVAVFLAVAAFSWGYLSRANLTTGPQYAIHGEMLVPPLLFAAGHGFHSLAGPNAAVHDFVSHKTASFSPAQLPEPLELVPITGKFLYDRLYLLYAIGLTWRLFGISWGALNILIAGIHGVIALLSYLLFRLGMGRILSLLGTAFFVTSPVVLAQLPALRDLCKGPFFLATIFCLGYLLANRVRVRPLVLSALGMGFFLGLGMGFRQDSIICLPPLLIGLVCARGVPPLRWTTRAALPVLFLVCFLIPAWPVLKMNRETGGNNSFYLIQGFSRPSMDQLGLDPASYAAVYSAADQAIHAWIVNYDDVANREGDQNVRTVLLARSISSLPISAVSAVIDYSLASFSVRQTGIYSRRAEVVARHIVRELAGLFPADIVSRWYAAVLRIARNLQNVGFHGAEFPLMRSPTDYQGFLVRHLGVFGPAYAAAALAILAGASLRLGFGALLLVLYFCGYTSLQFEVRHAFHLNFVSYWFMGFVLSIVAQQACRAYRVIRTRGCSPFMLPPRSWVCTSGARLAVFLLVSVLVFCATLYPARLYQRLSVGALYERYAQADLEAVPVLVEEGRGGRLRYRPCALPGFERNFLSRDILSEYLVAEFEVSGSDIQLTIDYDDPEANLDGRDRLPGRGASGPRTVRYFFPAFDFSERYQRHQAETGAYKFAEFSGISLPRGVAFKAMYRVRNRKDFPLLISVCWSPEAEFFKWRHEVPAFGPPEAL